MSQKRLPSLDGLRGVAVLLVFSFHIAGGSHSSWWLLRWFGLVNKAGWAGVSIFFVLSGFLITGILWDGRTHPHWWRNFYARRTVRIFPLYFLALALVLVSAAMTHTFSLALHRMWTTFAFLQDIPGPPLDHINNDGSPLVLLHFWSLAVEEQFYLIWPFVLVRLRSERRALILCGAVFVGSLLFRVAIFGWLHGPDPWGQFLLSRAGEMAAGGALAMLYRTRYWDRITRSSRLLLVLGVGTLICTSVVSRTAELRGPLQNIFGILAATIASAALLRLALAGGLIERILRWRVLRFFGTISYGVYVYHLLLLPVFAAITLRLVGDASVSRFLAVRLLVSLVLTVTIASLSFYLFERPISRIRRRFPVSEASPANV